MRTVNLGIIGLGTVGGGVVKLIQHHHDKYVQKYGIDLRIVKACSRSANAGERLGIPAENYTQNWQEVANNPEVDIVIELIGGEHPAMEIFETAFANKKHIITANKALLGRHMEHLAKLANENGVQLRCEAAAAGGIPVVHALEHDLMANDILTIAGIMNGTTNYILSRMKNEGLDFDEVLTAAQAAGYAEADPTADVEGYDAASKIAILSSIGFQSRISTDDVFTQGIQKISATDIEMARECGRVIKLLAIARKTPEGADVRVHPTMIPENHQLASVDGAMNAVFVVGDAVGETMFYGAGAGSFPTASAVCGDIMALAESISRDQIPIAEKAPFTKELEILNIDERQTEFYLRLEVADKVGTLTTCTSIFAKHGVSISRINQNESNNENTCELIFFTHKASEKSMRETCEELNQTNGVTTVASLIRVEDTSTWNNGIFDN